MTASSCDDKGTTWFFSSCGGILELRQGIQASSCVGPGSSFFHSTSEGELGVALESLQGKATSSRLVSRTKCSSPAVTGISGSHSSLTRWVRPHLEEKQRTPLSSRVATCISWSPLSGLKGVRPPVEFGERTPDCSPEHAGKEGPHLTMTGPLVGFLKLWRQCGVSHEVRWGYQGASTVAPGKTGLHAVGRGSTALLLSQGRGLGPQDPLKKDSLGLSWDVAGNPGFPRIVLVTLRSFSGCV